MIALARRAVACKGWRWMPGMEFDLNGAGALSSGWRIQSVQMRAVNGWARAVRTVTAGPCEFIIAPRGNIHVRFLDSTIASKPSGTAMLPVLDDPATLGCLLALVREAHAVPFLQVSVKISREHGYQFDCHPHHRGQWVDSEAEALVAALEDAP
jgi:hypothetical protein